MDQIPERFSAWFSRKKWKIHPHQKTLYQNYQSKKSTLLIAPTGAGKTLAALLPSLIDLYKRPQKNKLHTLYISPLKALTYDIERNLEAPIHDMQLPIEVGIRTGDTTTHTRQKQKQKPPNILLTTPESLMILLSYPEAKEFFKDLQWVIIDECHSFAFSKRGDYTSLALSNLARIAPQHRRCGLSATVANPEYLAQWIGSPTKPVILFTSTKKRLPIYRYSLQKAPFRTVATMPITQSKEFSTSSKKTPYVLFLLIPEPKQRNYFKTYGIIIKTITPSQSITAP